MSKPKILIYANVYDTTVGQGISYMNFFSQFGDVMLITSEMNLEYWIEHGDILALPGGMDLSPMRYDMRPGFNMKQINAHFEYLDENLLNPWLETGKPIIGICRGLQALNVACGGTLHRHVEAHIQDDKKGRWEKPQSMYTIFKGNSVVDINTYHHQAIRRLAPGFEVLGWTDVDDDCPSLSQCEYKNHKYWYDKKNNYSLSKSKEVYPMLPEIIRHVDRPYLAFQYHPEEFNCRLAIRLINETLKSYGKILNAEEETSNQNV